MANRRPRWRRQLRVAFRRSLAKLDRRSPALLMWVPSWGTSLLVHATALLLLGLYFYAFGAGNRAATFDGTFAKQLTNDVTSLVDSDHAGDPFTVVKTPDSPSFALAPSDPEVKLVIQPALPQLARFGPELTSPTPGFEPPAPKAKGFKPGIGRPKAGGGTLLNLAHSEDLTAPFSGRSEATRGAMVRREGGTVQSEKAVEDGIRWIVRHQRLDGGWSLNYQGQCLGAGCPPQTALESDTAATGLALLTLLGAGHTHTVKSRYQENVRNGIDWLRAHQNAAGDLFIGGDRMSYLYSHAIATMALCEAYGLSKDERLREPAQRAILFIMDAQNTSTGGWRYAPGQSGDTSVFGWQMFALRSARLAGLDVPKNVLKGCKVYLDSAAVDDRKATYSYTPGGPASPVMTAEALLSRQYLGWPHDFPALVKGAKHVAADLRKLEQRNIYYWYYATQMLHNMRNDDWERWNPMVRERLIAMQVKGEGCDRGSWDPVLPVPDRWANSAGRHYLTTLSVLTLEVYYRYLPLYEPTESEIARKAARAGGPPAPAPSPPKAGS